jgi:phage terminase small subunit
MPTNKLTPKQEAFVQAYLKTGNQRTAYREAYDAEDMKDNTVDRKAHDLAQNGKIRARLEQLQERIAEKTEVTVECISEMLKQDRDFARQQKQAAAATSATMGLAKLHGLIVNKSEDVTNRERTKDVDARIAQLIAEHSEAGVDEPSGTPESSTEPREALPTVSGHGTA